MNSLSIYRESELRVEAIYDEMLILAIVSFHLFKRFFMPRTKTREKVLHVPTTHEQLICLGSMPMYAKILLENSGPKPYTEFLKWLIEKKFFKDSQEKVSNRKYSKGMAS